MADYQEYRRRILRKRWRRTFAVAGLLVLLILLSAVGLLWKHLHREQSPAAVQGPTIFQQELQSSEWNTISYTPARRLTVQTTSAGSTAMDFRLAALDRTTAVDRSYFANVCFLGDSLTQGMQIYSSGLPEASFCAYRGANPSVVVNGTTCKRSDGGTEVPMEVLTALPHLLPAHAGYDLPGLAQHADLRAVHYACPARGAQQPSRPVQRAAVRDQQ